MIMLISKTPFRISFAGGLSDIRDYYKNDYGAVTSTSIDKYIYIVINKKFDPDIQLNYAKTEIVNNVLDIKHPIFREALKLVDLKKYIEISVMSDIPARTGLGSSSSFTVGLLNALYGFVGEHKDAETLAKQACKIEIDILKEPIGKQDQYASAFGGLNHIIFNSDESVEVKRIKIDNSTREELDDNLLLFYTGMKRDASEILFDSKKKMEVNREYIDQIRELSKNLYSALQKNDLSQFGELLHQNWEIKKRTGNVSNKIIDGYYTKALKAGAKGGKILGAGGGGFILLYCEKQFQKQVRKVLSDLREVYFHMETYGSRIVHWGD
jgi:D-glycero-alpha-D-manno-heptose-7-phosphate kinase